MKLRRLAAHVCQLAGIAAASVAGFVAYVPAGWAILGVGLIVFGVATERGGN